MSCNNGSGGSLVGVAGVSSNFPWAWDGFTSCFRGAGDGEVCRDLLLGLSLSADSLYEVGGLFGLRDWYRCSLGGTPCLSSEEGVGHREETCVMVGETAKGAKYQYIQSAIQTWDGNREKLRFQPMFGTYGGRRVLARAGRGIAAFVSWLHLV